jgi:predicted O-methyltransferase YrrM
MNTIKSNETCDSRETAIAHLPKVLLDALQEQRVFDGSGKQIPLHSNIALSEAVTLYQAVSYLKPAISAEVGFAQGISALAILKALADNGTGIHHIIDPFQSKYDDVGLAMVERAGLSARMRFHRQFADEVIPHLPELEFGFIDSSHLFDLTISEFVMMDRKLKVGGMVAFHDMWMPSLQKFLRYVLANRSYELVRAFDSSLPASPRTLKQALKQFMLRALHFFPGKECFFREELLRPWQSFHSPNLVLLRKTANDNRDWKFHAKF